MLFSFSRQRSIQFLILLGFLYTLFVIFEVSFVFKNGFTSGPREGSLNLKHAPIRHLDASYRSIPKRKINEFAKMQLSGFNLTARIATSKREIGLLKSANDAVELGRKLWQELELTDQSSTNISINKHEECPYSVWISGEEFSRNGKVTVLPCGLTLGSHITVVGKPKAAHLEMKPKISQYLMVSQFMLELQGLKTVDGEDPPRIFHFNPRLRGDWSGKPVIELNTCYRMQWGNSQRCEGWRSKADEETGE